MRGDFNLHWNCHLAGGGLESRSPCDTELASNHDLSAINQLWLAVRDKLLPGHELIRCYANAHTFGLDGGIHRDNPPEENMITTVVYVHRQWPLPWGGETVFYCKKEEDIVATVIPKPARVAIFDGSIFHAARAPTRVCTELRMTLVFRSMVIK